MCLGYRSPHKRALCCLPAQMDSTPMTCGEEAIWLYGSSARGDDDELSDSDVLYVEPQAPLPKVQTFYTAALGEARESQSRIMIGIKLPKWPRMVACSCTICGLKGSLSMKASSARSPSQYSQCPPFIPTCQARRSGLQRGGSRC